MMDQKVRKQPNRQKPIKTALMVAAIFEGSQNIWITVKDLHFRYVRIVGEISERALARYVSLLEETGFIECRRRSGLTAKRYYKWVGYPMPIQSGGI